MKTASDFDIAQLLMDEYNMKILAATSHKAKSARELAFMFDIPIASCYRKLRELAAAGLIKQESTELTADGKRYKVYRSQLDCVTLVYERGQMRMKVDMHLRTPIEIVRNMATPIKRDNSEYDQ
ncbi:MAG: helix-turn-helix domain-containing protein [Thermoplasmata archaeon]|nr:helix-turn-helix domain-containing protein [Thermoplasmata archaeon]